MSTAISLQYPIGRFCLDRSLSSEERSAAIDVLAALPQQLSKALDGLTDAQLNAPYRPGGWTIRQLVHHIADSDMTAFSWMRAAFTLNWPTVFDYDPAALAELADSNLPAVASLQLLDVLHRRWVCTLRSIPEDAWETHGYIHPESGRCTLGTALAMYAWHSRHHLAHILDWRSRNRW